MRRGIAFWLAVSALASLAPAAFGQYPYPYGPMPYAPMPYPPTPYGQMPNPSMPYGPTPYAPGPMMARPMQYPPMPQPMPYPPMPQWQGPAPTNTKVFVYGPLDDMAAPAPEFAAPQPSNLPPSPAAPAQAPAADKVMQTRGGGVSGLPTYSKIDLPTEACGPGGDCASGDCGAGCRPAPYEAPMRGKGHFIGDVGAYFLVPIASNRPAFSTSTPTGGTTSDFAHQLDVGPRITLGYMFHSGWGVRANYDYLKGSLSQSTANADPATTVATPVAGPFQLVSPSPALQSGIGVDQFLFTQRLERSVVDIEFMREGHILDTSFLFSVGGRYGRLMQSYNATRTNPGGANGATTVALDRDQLESSNFFEGWGPTVCFEILQPLKCGISAYANVRGSFLWGTGKFAQTDTTQTRTVSAAGVPTFTDTTGVSDNASTREVSILEAEAGLQYGQRCGRCYLFARTGFVYQRWFDVGNPTTASGSVTFLGGTIRAGISY